MTGDRLKGSLQALARRADPLAPYYRLYRARVAAQSGDLLRVDVEPDDPLLPPMSNIPLRPGIPGVTVSVAPGAYLMVGWENGSPDAPYAGLWHNPNVTGAANGRGTNTRGSGAVHRTTIAAALLELGLFGAADAVIKGTTYRVAEETMHATMAAQLLAATAALSNAASAGSFTLAQPFLAAAAIGLGLAANAITTFEAGKATFLSTIVRTG